MEKQHKLRNRIMKILPKAAAAVAVTFQNPPFSPGRDHKSRHHGGKGYSGPMIPYEARRKPKDGSNNNIDYQEPTSPKISCMGQIKHKKKQTTKDKTKKDTESQPKDTRNVASTPRDTEVKKHVSKFERMLLSHGSSTKPKSERRKSDASASQDSKDALAHRAPHMSQMKRFSSGRDTFANFDWKTQVAPDEEIDYDDWDEDREESDAEEDEVKIPFSAPILIGGGDGGVLNLKPRKEINLWKRRTMAPPRPLQLN